MRRFYLEDTVKDATLHKNPIIANLIYFRNWIQEEVVTAAQNRYSEKDALQLAIECFGVDKSDYTPDGLKINEEKFFIRNFGMYKMTSSYYLYLFGTCWNCKDMYAFLDRIGRVIKSAVPEDLKMLTPAMEEHLDYQIFWGP